MESFFGRPNEVFLWSLNVIDKRVSVTYCRDVYLDISCANCGPFHHQGKTPTACPNCGTQQIVVAPHDFEIDARFRGERNNMLDRMDVD